MLKKHLISRRKQKPSERSQKWITVQVATAVFLMVMIMVWKNLFVIDIENFFTGIFFLIIAFLAVDDHVFIIYLIKILRWIDAVFVNSAAVIVLWMECSVSLSNINCELFANRTE